MERKRASEQGKEHSKWVAEVLKMEEEASEESKPGAQWEKEKGR